MQIAALQHDIVWEDRDATLAHLRPQLDRAAGVGARLISLTEMFATGFSMQTHLTAETLDGPIVTWMHERAAALDVWIAGSVALQADAAHPTDPTPSANGNGSPNGNGAGGHGGAAASDLATNSLLLVGPDGTRHRYDKVHPFSYAGEHERFRGGDGPLVVEIEGLRIGLSVCYDLRFANLYWDRAGAVDVELIVANWPEARRNHWRTLLDARAIEDQVYVVGVNRVGTGGKLSYVGDSRIVDPAGEVLVAAASEETMLLAELDPDVVREVRERLPFLPDRR